MAKNKYLNRQLYSECQLVTVINAHIFYGGDRIDTGSYEYERLVDWVCARDGSAINIKKALDYFKLEARPLSVVSKDSIKACLDIGIPVALCVYHRIQGNHSVLVTNYCGDIFKVLNWKVGQEFKWKDLDKCINRGTNMVGAIGRNCAIVELNYSNRGKQACECERIL